MSKIVRKTSPGCSPAGFKKMCSEIPFPHLLKSPGKKKKRKKTIICPVVIDSLQSRQGKIEHILNQIGRSLPIGEPRHLGPRIALLPGGGGEFQRQLVIASARLLLLQRNTPRSTPFFFWKRGCFHVFLVVVIFPLVLCVCLCLICFCFWFFLGGEGGYSLLLVAVLFLSLLVVAVLFFSLGGGFTGVGLFGLRLKG